jgi:serine protease Do
MKNKIVLGALAGLAVALLIAWSPVHQLNSSASAVVQPLTTQAAPSEALQKPALSPLNAAKQMSEAFVDVSKKVTPSIVMIVNEEKLQSTFGDDAMKNDFFNNFFNFSPQQREQVQKTLGSGVIVSADGYIITNNHVVDNSTRLQVTLPDGDKVPAKIIGKDPKTDLALIKVVRSGLKPVTFGNYQDVQVGEWVLAVGTPFAEALHHTVTAGIVSAKGRSNVGIADYEDFLQTDAAINPGNSGGALVDLDGHLIGINTAILSNDGSNSGVGFAIPVNIVSSVMQQLKSNGRVIRGYLGVTIQDLTSEMKKSLDLKDVDGAVISGVEKDSPADNAGLKTYDVITSVDGKPVHNSFELRQAISSIAPGNKTELAILRDGKEKILDVNVSELKNDAAPSDQPRNRTEKLGVELQALTSQLARRLGAETDHGVVVTGVASGSAAEEAGLQQGDVIFEVDRRNVDSVREFQELVKNETNSSVLLAVDRQGGSLFITLQLE